MAVTVTDRPALRRPAPPRRAMAWRALVPLAIGTVIAVTPVPQGLSANAWYYFALFAAVIAGIITEPVPPAILGLAGVTIAAVLRLVRASPADATSWALSGFANSTVWLIFAAYMFALGYSQTGLGRRIALQLIRVMGKRTLGLGYAVAFADLVLAPFTPSTTARSGGTIYPVIRNIPELYGSRPDDESARKIGAYLLYTAVATSCVTSSMFLTGLAPNALAMSIIVRTLNVTVSWMDWFKGFAPVGVVLFILVPVLLYKIYPPEIKEAPEAPLWAAQQLQEIGPITRHEIAMLLLVIGALALWIGAAAYIDPAMVAILVVVLMVVLRVVSWDQVIGNAQAWNVLVWFATLVTLAAGLAETRFLDWIARSIAPTLAGLSVYATIVTLVGAFFFLHYFFASLTAHAAALFPVFLGIAIKIPGVSPVGWALLLGYSIGLMGILTSYASGQVAIYYGSGYIKRRDFWVLGFIMSVVFFLVYVAIIVPWLAYLQI
jgi:L-tartrate/succinate antiporter